MTIIEDTLLTLAGILFKVEANNSLIFLPLQTYEKKFAEFLFLFIFIIPWSKLLPLEVDLLYSAKKKTTRCSLEVDSSPIQGCNQPAYQDF